MLEVLWMVRMPAPPAPATEVTAKVAEERAREFCLAALKVTESSRQPDLGTAKIVRDDFTSEKWATPVWWVEFAAAQCAVDARDGTIRAYQRATPMFALVGDGGKTTIPTEKGEDLAGAYFHLTKGSEAWKFESKKQGTYANQPALLMAMASPDHSQGFMAIDSHTGQLIQLTRRKLGKVGSLNTPRKNSRGETSPATAIAAARAFTESVMESLPYQPKLNLNRGKATRDDTVTRAWTTPIWDVSFDYASCSVDQRTGEIRIFRNHPPVETKPSPRNSVREKLPRLVERYARMAGSRYPLKIDRISRQENGYRVSYDLNLRYFAGPIAFPRFPGCGMELDAQTGMLTGLVLRQPLDLPGREIKPVAKDCAVAAAVTFAFSDRRIPGQTSLFNLNPPAVVQVAEGPELNVWRPNPDESEEGRNLLNPELAALGKAGKTILTYWVMLVDAESFSPGLGTYARRYIAQVDAEKGNVVAFTQMQPASAGSLQGVKSPPKPTVPPRLAGTPLGLIRGQSSQVVKKAGWEIGGKDGSRTRPVAIQMGTTYWRGRYDRAANVLVLGSETSPTVVVPDPNLREALNGR